MSKTPEYVFSTIGSKSPPTLSKFPYLRFEQIVFLKQKNQKKITPYCRKKSPPIIEKNQPAMVVFRQ